MDEDSSLYGPAPRIGDRPTASDHRHRPPKKDGRGEDHDQEVSVRSALPGALTAGLTFAVGYTVLQLTLGDSGVAAALVGGLLGGLCFVVVWVLAHLRFGRRLDRER